MENVVINVPATALVGGLGTAATILSGAAGFIYRSWAKAQARRDKLTNLLIQELIDIAKNHGGCSNYRKEEGGTKESKE